MFGLEIIAAGMIYMAPTPIVSQIECHAKTPPRLNVHTTKSQIKYDFTRTKAQLNTINVDTISPYGSQHKTNVSGLMSSTITPESTVAFIAETYPPSGGGCVYLKAINVVINVDPTIFIAKEFPKGGCMHSAILAHEFKHIEADQRIINKYVNLMGQALSDAMDREGTTYGPIKDIRIKEVQRDIQQTFQDVVQRMTDRMNKERERDQQAIDNIEEYDSIGKRCKSSSERGRR